MFTISISNTDPRYNLVYSAADTLEAAVRKALSARYPELESVFASLPLSTEATPEDIQILGGGFDFDWTVGQSEYGKENTPVPLPPVLVSMANVMKLPLNVPAFPERFIMSIVGGREGFPKAEQMLHKDVIICLRPPFFEDTRKAVADAMKRMVSKHKSDIKLEHLVRLDRSVRQTLNRNGAYLSEVRLYADVITTDSVATYALVNGVNLKLDSFLPMIHSTSIYPIRFWVGKGAKLAEIDFIVKFCDDLMKAKTAVEFSKKSLELDLVKNTKQVSDMLLV